MKLRKPLPRRRSRPRRSLRVRDEGYKATVRGLPCAMRFVPILGGTGPIGFCEGEVEPDHQGERGVGQKADDTSCVPMCHKHHRDRTDYRGYFKGWDGQRMRDWCNARIVETTVKVERLRAGEDGPSLW